MLSASKHKPIDMSTTTVENSFQAAVEAGHINGAIMCAINTDGSFQYNKTTGDRTLLSGEKKPHQLDDLLFLASATKLMTTIAALACVQDGLLSLTGDLSHIAPELTDKQVLTGFTDDDQPILERPIRAITLEMLLTHSSGLAYHFLDPKIARWRSQNAPQAQSNDTGSAKPTRYTVEGLITYPLTFQPGNGWMYGPNLDWAGRIVERVTGITLLAYLQRRVFTPLNISSAQFHPVTREDLRARMVDLNPLDPEGLGAAVTGGSADMNKLTDGDFGGHGLFMTAPDYLKVLHTVMLSGSDKTGIIDAKLVDSMFSNHLNNEEAITSHAGKCASPLGVFFRCGVDNGTALGHGLGGLLTLEDSKDWYGTHTLTWGGGVTFAWFVDRTNGLCGVCALQATLPVVNFQAVGELKQIFREDIYRKYRQHT